MPRARLPEIRRQVRAELTHPEPDRAHIDELLREGSGIFLMLERAVVANVLDSRRMLPPDAERKYVDLISRLQLEGPGQLGRLPPAQWPWWWRFRPPQPAPAGPLTPLDKDRPATRRRSRPRAPQPRLRPLRRTASGPAGKPSGWVFLRRTLRGPKKGPAWRGAWRREVGEEIVVSPAPFTYTEEAGEVFGGRGSGVPGPRLLVAQRRGGIEPGARARRARSRRAG